MATAINKNFGQGFNWVHFAQHAIPTDALEKLQLTAWNLPQLDISSKLLARVAELFHLAAHVRDFLRLPDRDEYGNILLQDYLTRFAKHITELLQQTLQSEEELMEQLKSIKPEILENNSAFTEILETLEEFHQNILPATEKETDITMSIKEIADWASRLEKGYISASKIAVWWTFLVLEQNTMQAVS